VYVVATAALTWPLAPRVAHDLPGDLIDPLYTCWALAWNFHALGLSGGGPPASYLDANIFHPVLAVFVRSEHFLPQALQGALVFAITHNLVLTYNLLFAATFVLSGAFFYLLAREETGDHGAALGAGLLFAFALLRWTHVSHLGALSSQWMPLALLLARRAAGATRPWPEAAWAAGLGGVTALQMLSSGYYLLFFPPFLAIWAAVEARRAGGGRAWLRLGAAGAVAVALTLPLVLPYIALRGRGASRDLDTVVSGSADLLSWVTAPALSLGWGRVLDFFPRGEGRLFPGLVTPALAAIALVAAGSAVAQRIGPEAPPSRWRRGVRVCALVLAALGLVAALAATRGGLTFEVAALRVRAVGVTRPALLMLAAAAAAVAGWPRLVPIAGGLARRRELLAIGLCALAVWLSLGPIVTFGGRPVPFPSAYRWAYEHVPGFDAGRAPARCAMIAACFGALAAAWGLKHLRTTRGGRRWAWLLCAAFLIETAPGLVPLDEQGYFVGGPYQFELQDLESLPRWRGGAPSPIVADIRELPAEAVLAILPFGEIFHETRAMFDSTHHWRRLLNGYSSWIPPEYVDHAIAFRDPLRNAPAVLAALRESGATHVVVHEGGWARGKGVQVTARLVAAGARPVARAEDEVLLAVR
jgi:hypothetical protein